MKDIIVFICEDEEVGREIVGKYLKEGQVTYASFFKAEKRNEIADLLDKVE